MLPVFEVELQHRPVAKTGNALGDRFRGLHSGIRTGRPAGKMSAFPNRQHGRGVCQTTPATVMAWAPLEQR